MSPSYREPNQAHKKDEASRSGWSTVSIFLALGFLTFMMGLLVYGAIRGASAPGGDALDRQEIRASR